MVVPEPLAEDPVPSGGDDADSDGITGEPSVLLVETPEDWEAKPVPGGGATPVS